MKKTNKIVLEKNKDKFILLRISSEGRGDIIWSNLRISEVLILSKINDIKIQENFTDSAVKEIT